MLWVCSALFQGSPVEAQFVLKWIQALRSSGSERLRNAPILVRPHPSRLAEWQDVDLSGSNAVLWGGNPIDAQSRADYFDSLYHSAAVVGINTSAFIEGGIVGLLQVVFGRCMKRLQINSGLRLEHQRCIAQLQLVERIPQQRVFVGRPAEAAFLGRCVPVRPAAFPRYGASVVTEAAVMRRALAPAAR